MLNWKHAHAQLKVCVCSTESMRMFNLKKCMLNWKRPDAQWKLRCAMKAPHSATMQTDRRARVASRDDMPWHEMPWHEMIPSRGDKFPGSQGESNSQVLKESQFEGPQCQGYTVKDWSLKEVSSENFRPFHTRRHTVQGLCEKCTYLEFPTLIDSWWKQWFLC